MPRVDRVLETAIYVDDLPRSAAFYQSLFGFVALVETERLVVFDVGGKSMLLLFNRGQSAKGLFTPSGWIPPHDSIGPAHFAFGIAREEREVWRAWLTESGIEIESTVEWERGGTSIYFRDPDNHSVELVTPGTWETW